MPESNNKIPEIVFAMYQMVSAHGSRCKATDHGAVFRRPCSISPSRCRCGKKPNASSHDLHRGLDDARL